MDSYPEIPRISGDKVISVPQNILRKLINRTSFAVAIDESRPILTGCLMELTQDNIRFVALDGYRVAIADAPFSTNTEKNVVIPGKALNEIAKILAEDDTLIDVCIQEKHVLFDLGHTQITSRLLEGDFIKYKNVLPVEFASSIIINRKALEDSIERASLIARENKANFIVMSIRENILVITSKSETSQAHEEIPITLTGNELEIAFNSKFFSDCLREIDNEFIKISFNTNLSPCVVKPSEGEEFLYLILPIRM
ncbi:MAG TPA: DNA polymerase III subunit beta [Clostridia bacterium]|nr:DNA polymerase III subunit beta [Clostridia bacterium]